MVKNPPTVQETWVWSLGCKDPLEKGKATHSSIVVWRIPWTEEPDGLQFMGSPRVRHDWATNTFSFHTSQRSPTDLHKMFFFFQFGFHIFPNWPQDNFQFFNKDSFSNFKNSFLYICFSTIKKKTVLCWLSLPWILVKNSNWKLTLERNIWERPWWSCG